MSGRLTTLRGELGILDEQLAYLAADVDDARLQALVSETPLAERAMRDASRHLQTVLRRRDEVSAEILALETRQDELLDELTA